MARYLGPVGKVSRRLGIGITPKGERVLRRRPTPPGQHGGDGRPRKISDYGMQLMEKQKLRFLYGLQERPFVRVFETASRQKGVTGDNLMRLLECRLDNVVYRLGLAITRAQARQIVNHGHITVDGRRTDIASYTIRVGQVVAVAEKSRRSAYFRSLDPGDTRHRVPEWLARETDGFSCRVVALPRREHGEQDVNVPSVVEFYSR